MDTMKNSKFEQNLNNCKQKLAELNSILPSEIDYRNISLKAKIPFVVLGYRGALIHRVTELAGSSIDLFEKPKSAISAILLTRAVMETTAMLFVLHKRLNESLNMKNTDDLKKYLDKNIFGWRTEANDDLPKMPNILGAIDQVDNYLDGKFRAAYEGLSEYCHPNCAGVHLAYIKLDKINRRADIGAEFTALETEAKLGILLISLEIFIEKYKQISNKMEEFINVCEYEIENKI
jgi:hypothetical protein